MRYIASFIVPCVAVDMRASDRSRNLSPQPLQLPPPTSQCLRADASERVAVYESVLQTCTEPSNESEECVREDTGILIEGYAEPVVVGDLIGRGTYGAVYKTNWERIVVKTGQVCVDKAVLKALKDVDDPPLPKEHALISTNKKCADSTLVMDKIGDSDWYNVMIVGGKTVGLKDGFTRVYRLLLELKKFHSSGFAHGDFHEKNIRVSKSDPMFIGIIDMGMCLPMIPSTAKEGDPYGPGRNRFMNDLSLVKRNICGYLSTHQDLLFDTDWIDDGLEFFSLMEPGIGECANYDLWVWLFKQLADSNNIPDTANRIKELIFPNFPSTLNKIIQDRIAKALIDGKDPLYVRFPKSFRPPIPDEFFSPQQHPGKTIPFVSGILEDQRKTDLAYPETRPYLMLDSELIYEPSSEGGLKARVIAVGNQVTPGNNFCVYDAPGYRIEYRVNCDDLDGDLLGMQREFGLTKLGAKLGIGFEGIWMSPPVRFMKTTKLMIENDRSQQLRCMRDPRSHVRYMVTESWESNLRQSAWLLESKTAIQRVKIGLKFAKFFIEKLKIVHREYGIVYGRMNLRNIAFKEQGDEQYIFKLDNFGKSFFNSEVVVSEDCDDCDIGPNTRADPRYPCDQTHWNMEGSRLSFRDDVFNVLLVAAWIISKDNHGKNFCSLLGGKEEENVRMWKQSAHIFESVHKTLGGGDDADMVLGALDAAVEIARSVDTEDKLPDHDSILSRLEFALSRVINYKSL